MLNVEELIKNFQHFITLCNNLLLCRNINYGGLSTPTTLRDENGLNYLWLIELEVWTAAQTNIAFASIVICAPNDSVSVPKCQKQQEGKL